MNLREHETGDETIHTLLESVTDTIEQARKWREQQDKFDADFESLLEVSCPVEELLQSEEFDRTPERERAVIRCSAPASKLDMESLLHPDPKKQINYELAELDTAPLSLLNSKLQSQLADDEFPADEPDSSVPTEKDHKLWDTVDSIEKELKELEDMMGSVSLSI